MGDHSQDYLSNTDEIDLLDKLDRVVDYRKGSCENSSDSDEDLHNNVEGVDSSSIKEEDTMDTNSYDAWESSAYYNGSSGSSNTLSPIQPTSLTFDVTQKTSIVVREDPLDIVEVVDETLEENNNDPNNNLDSIEITGLEMEANNQAAFVTREEAPSYTAQAMLVPEFPKPGCSKDLPAMSNERHESAVAATAAARTPNEPMIYQKVGHILRLMARANHESVFEALCKNDKVPIDQLKLWDLIPQTTRLDYPAPLRKRVETNASITDHAEMEWTSALSGPSGTAKRGPQEDICTVEWKKSSNPDLSKVQPAPVASSSSISRYVEPAVSRGAIPKVRCVSGKHGTANPSKNRISPPIMVNPVPKMRHRFDELEQFERESSRTGEADASRIVKSGAATIVAAVQRDDKRAEALPIYHEVAKRSHSLVNPQIPIQPPRISYTAGKTLQSGTSIKAPCLKYPRGVISPVTADPPSRKAPIERTNIVDLTARRALASSSVAAAASPKLVPAATKAISSDARGSVVTAPNPQKFEQQQQILQHEKPKNQQPQQRQNAERAVCMEMYYKLIGIFPNVDPEYVRNLCPPDWGPGDHEAQLRPIVEYLLTKGDTLPPARMKPTPDASAENVGSVDGVYENLLGIFPDADPHYLREFAVANVGNADAVKNFVDSKLQHRDYPTREQYKARLKITEQQRQYTKNFSVKQFISIIPNPSKHFMDPQRKCIYNTVAFEFLKSYYNKYRVNTISRSYSRCNYNLSQTAFNLEDLTPDLQSKRGGREMPTEDIVLLQEIAFIKHRAEIDAYTANIERIEKEEFNRMKAMNQLLECQCCYDSECVPSKCSTCDNGHIFCTSCIIAGTKAKMAEDGTRIYCFLNCGSEFSLSVLQEVIAPTTFSILLKKRQAAEVMQAGLEGLVSCPFCHFASIPPEGDKIFKCLNPECTKESCRLCKEPSHVPFKCDELQKADNARRYIEEKMTEALARKCYKCQRAYVKEDGCNKITCPCGAKMCYLCDQPINDYSHFRGQGSNDTKLCPLYTDTIRLDAVTVRKVGEQAQIDMMKRNPNIKIDASNLLPEIPRARHGPHNDIVNADELPRRAQRVLDQPPL